MISNDMVNTIINAVGRYNNCLSNNNGVKTAKESLKNVLFGCYPELVELATESNGMSSAKETKQMQAKIDEMQRYIDALNGTIEELNKQLMESDEETNEMRKELRKLKESRKGKADDASGKA